MMGTNIVTQFLDLGVIKRDLRKQAISPTSRKARMVYNGFTDPNIDV